jgi:hypothetical protein
MKELNSEKDVIVIIDDDTVEYQDTVEYHKESKDSCCICLDEDELDYLLECCNNKIHSKCIQTWYSYKKSRICPLCKHGDHTDQNYESDLLTALIPTENEARLIVRPLIYLFVYLIIMVILKLNKN